MPNKSKKSPILKYKIVVVDAVPGESDEFTRKRRERQERQERQRQINRLFMPNQPGRGPPSLMSSRSISPGSRARASFISPLLLGGRRSPSPPRAARAASPRRSPPRAAIAASPVRRRSRSPGRSASPVRRRSRSPARAAIAASSVRRRSPSPVPVRAASPARAAPRRGVCQSVRDYIGGGCVLQFRSKRSKKIRKNKK